MTDWLLAQQGLYVYILLFLALMGGAVGAPIPEDAPLLIAGYLIYTKSAAPLIILLVCYGTILLGDLVIFLIGRKLGPRLFSLGWMKKRMPPSRIRRMKLNLEKRSLLMIFLARHLFYLRTITFLTCGAVKMRPERFILADACAALVSVPLMLSIGYLGGEHLNLIMSSVKKAEYLLLVIGIIVISAIVYYRLKRRSEKKPPIRNQEDSSNL